MVARLVIDFLRVVLGNHNAFWIATTKLNLDEFQMNQSSSNNEVRINVF